MAAKLTKDQQMMFAGVAGVLFVLYFYWVYLMKPVMADIKAKAVKYDDLQKQVALAENQARRLPALKSELDKLENELASLEKQLPTQKDLPGILRLLTREAVSQNINFLFLHPLDPRRETYFDVIEFEMSVTGSLHSFARFVTSLGQQDRIFQVDQVKINSPGTPDAQGNMPPLNITFELKTYAYAG